MKLHISKHNTKLGAFIPSINLPPVITCRPDAPCYKNCYARKGRFAFTRNKNLLMSNLQLWQEDPLRFEVEAEIGIECSRYARWHSAGDIPDAEYFQMMIRVAEKLSDVRFLCFTKKYEIVNAYLDDHDGVLPSNLAVVLSPWGDNFMPYNPYNLPLAYIRLSKEPCTIPANAHECPGYCGECAAREHSCWNLKRGESVVFDQH